VTRRVIERSEYQELFRSFNTSLFRLEARNEYRVPFEEDAFRRFLDGAPLKPDEGDLAWRDLIRKHRNAGRKWQKVHIVDLPLTDYLRFEIAAAYDVFAPVGEEVRMIERRIGSITDSFDGDDFWLFDDAQLVLMRYSDDGKVLARELVVDEPELIAQYIERKEKALAAATPYREFCDGIAFTTQ
jgi:hypothetical protein